MHSLMPILIGVRNALVLLVWGSGVLWLAFSARLQTYLHPSLQPFAIAGGIFLMLLAGFSVLGLAMMRRETCRSCSCVHDHHDVHERNEWPGIIAGTMVLILPVVVAFSGNADRFTATTVANRGVVQDLSKLPSANASVAKVSGGEVERGLSEQQTVGPMPLQVIDLLYALQMPSYREEFEGKEVELIGQYVPMTTGYPAGDRFQAIRMFITCCAADAKPLGVTVRSSQLPKVSEMQWVKITGKPSFPMEGGKRAAILEASKVESCDAPSDPFVY